VYSVLNKHRQNRDQTRTKRGQKAQTTPVYSAFLPILVYLCINYDKMGKLTNGINGAIQGKVGTVIGSSWKGIPYIKGPYKKRTGKVGKGEKVNRTRFGAAQLWLKPLLDFVRQGFKGYSPTVEGFIAAKSYLLLNAFEGAGTKIAINPALVKVSFGHLPLSDDITVEKVNTRQLLFSWNPSPVTDGSPKDQAMLLAYAIDHRIAYFTITGEFRSTGSDTLQLDNKKGRTYHIYFAFTADDRSRQSDSVYLGTVTT
jgi:hypothetical protein